MNLPASGPSADCSKLLVSDTIIFFDQSIYFLEDVLVSKQKISYLRGFDHIAYIYHENTDNKFSLKIQKR